MTEEERKAFAAGMELAAKIAEPKRKQAPLKGGGWFKAPYRDKASVASIQVRQQIAENIRTEKDNILRATTYKAQKICSTCDYPEGYCGQC